MKDIAREKRKESQRTKDSGLIQELRKSERLTKRRKKKMTPRIKWRKIGREILKQTINRGATRKKKFTTQTKKNITEQNKKKEISNICLEMKEKHKDGGIVRRNKNKT